MALLIFVRSNYGGKLPVSIQCHNLHSFREGMNLLCQSILETKQLSHLFSSALLTVPLMWSLHYSAFARIKLQTVQLGYISPLIIWGNKFSSRQGGTVFHLVFVLIYLNVLNYTCYMRNLFTGKVRSRQKIHRYHVITT